MTPNGSIAIVNWGQFCALCLLHAGGSSVLGHRGCINKTVSNKMFVSQGLRVEGTPRSAGEQPTRCHKTPQHFGLYHSPDLPFQGFLRTDKSGKGSKEDCLVTTQDKIKLLEVEFWGKPQEECIISHQSTRPISWYAVLLFSDIFLSFSEVGTSEFLFLHQCLRSSSTLIPRLLYTISRKPKSNVNKSRSPQLSIPACNMTRAG